MPLEYFPSFHVSGRDELDKGNFDLGQEGELPSGESRLSC